MSKLIKYVFGIFFILALAYTSFAQQRVRVVPVQRYTIAPRNAVRPNGSVRKVQQVKEGFISQQLNLTPKESKQFWPLYRQYEEQLTAVRILKRINNSNSTTDGTAQIDRDLEYETQLVVIKKKYKDEFLKVLPPEKVSELYKSERQFNDEVLKQLSERSVRAGD
ncbi:hypothetical protein [Mucilaginibacter sp.]|uniref:hypothetical protein n=1 Tax=Mucilaginibacter sp. TaxID=1882438 RepID=UPI003D129305